MSDNPRWDPRAADEVSQLRRLQDWWLDLPLSYRMNALLYLLGACALLFLVTTLFSGNDTPRQIQVGAGATTTTTKPKAGAQVSGSGSSTTVGGSTTTTRASSTTTVAGTGGAAGGGAGGSGAGGGGSGGGSSGSGGGSGGGGSGGGGSSDTTQPSGGNGGSDTTQPTSPPGGNGTTTPPPPAPCRNSTEARCGSFRWDPAPSNRAPSIEITSDPRSLPTYDQLITFSVRVTEPDHSLSGACGTMDFGDGVSEGGCPAPPCGPTRYGPWETPAPPGSDTRTFTFQHRYARQNDPKPFTVTFRLESRSDCYDPYGTAFGDAAGTKSAPIVVTVRS